METKWIWAAMTLLLGVFAACGVGFARAAPLGSITEYTGGTPCSVAPLAPVCSGSLYAGGSPGRSRSVRTATSGSTTRVPRSRRSGGSRRRERSPSSAEVPVAAARRRFCLCAAAACMRAASRATRRGPGRQPLVRGQGTNPAIGRITPSGTITEFSSRLGAAAGPHGDRGGPGRQPLVHRRAAHRRSAGSRRPASITEFQAGLTAGSKPCRHHGGPGRQPLVRRQRQTKRSGGSTHRRRDHRVHRWPHRSSHPGRHRGGPGRQPLVHRPGHDTAIGRITTTGTVTEFSSGSERRQRPERDHGGPGRQPLVHRQRHHAGDREITPSGTITEFTITAPGSSPRGIATGPDGNLWFSDDATSAAIGQFGVGAPAASVTAPVVTGSGGEGIPQTCGGDVWSSWAGEQPSHSAFGYDGYQWLVDGSPIAGAGGTSYTPTIGDIGHELSCKAAVTYTLFPVTVASTSAAVTVADLTPPVLSRPAPIMVGATDPHGATVSYSASATDNVDPSPVVSCTPTSGSTFPIGTTTVNCTATDASGNVAHGSFTVQVEGAAAQLADLDAAVEGVGPGDILALTVAGAQSSSRTVIPGPPA